MKKRSIGFRLAAWYFMVLACGLAAFSVGAWFAMRASTYHAVDAELRDRVRGVQSFMDHQISSLSVPEIRDEFREQLRSRPWRRSFPGLRPARTMAVSLGRT